MDTVGLDRSLGLAGGGGGVPRYGADQFCHPDSPDRFGGPGVDQSTTRVVPGRERGQQQQRFDPPQFRDPHGIPLLLVREGHHG